MKRVYTDDRFPGYEVINDGSGTFAIQHHGRPVDTFESFEKKVGQISEAFAARRAQEFFDRNATLSETLDGIPADRDATDIVNNPPSSKHNAAVIDRMLAREKTEKDPEAKKRLRHNIMQLMKQEETLAEAVVSHLIEG